MSAQKLIIRLVIAAALSVAVIFAYKTYQSSVEQTGIEAETQAFAQELVVFPKVPIEGCRGGRAKLYDECNSQVVIFQNAFEAAESEGKTLLVSFGAEWCIWCHVFKSYIKGEHSEFTHTYSDQTDKERFTSTIYERASQKPELLARDVVQFTSENFVIVHIESQYSEDGYDVLNLTSARSSFARSFPFIYTVDEDGQFLTSFNSGLAETRRDTADWFRGYDRVALLQELKRLRAGAVSQ